MIHQRHTLLWKMPHIQGEIENLSEENGKMSGTILFSIYGTDLLHVVSEPESHGLSSHSILDVTLFGGATEWFFNCTRESHILNSRCPNPSLKTHNCTMNVKEWLSFSSQTLWLPCRGLHYFSFSGSSSFQLISTSTQSRSVSPTCEAECCPGCGLGFVRMGRQRFHPQCIYF